MLAPSNAGPLNTKQIREIHAEYTREELTLEEAGRRHGKPGSSIRHYFNQLGLPYKKKQWRGVVICKRSECGERVTNHNSKYCSYECSHKDRVLKGETVQSLRKEIKELKQTVKQLKSELKSMPSDTCERCGCNEFLCGHNKR